MIDYGKTAGTQHRFYASAIRNPPVRGIASILLFDEIHARKLRLLENFGLPEIVVVLYHRHTPTAALHRLKNKTVTRHVFANKVEGQQWMAQVVKHPHEKNEVEFLIELRHVVNRELAEFDVDSQCLSDKPGLGQI